LFKWILELGYRVKGESSSNCYIALFTQVRLSILEVAADWHEHMN